MRKIWEALIRWLGLGPPPPTLAELWERDRKIIEQYHCDHPGESLGPAELAELLGYTEFESATDDYPGYSEPPRECSIRFIGDKDRR